MSDAYWEPKGDYDSELRKNPESARGVYRDLAFLLGVGEELSPHARKFLAERLWRVSEMKDCAEALGLKKPRNRPAETMEDRNRYLVEMEVLISVHALSVEKASEVLGEYHCREKSKFKKLRDKHPETVKFIQDKVAAGYTLAWSRLPDDLVHLVPHFSPERKI